MNFFVRQHDSFGLVARTGTDSVTFQVRYGFWDDIGEASIILAHDNLLAIAIVGFGEQFGFFAVRSFFPAVHDHVYLVAQQSLFQVRIADFDLSLLDTSHQLSHSSCDLDLKANQIVRVGRIFKYIRGSRDVVSAPLQVTGLLQTSTCYFCSTNCWRS